MTPIAEPIDARKRESKITSRFSDERKGSRLKIQNRERYKIMLLNSLDAILNAAEYSDPGQRRGLGDRRRRRDPAIERMKIRHFGQQSRHFGQKRQVAKILALLGDP
jgi:hypothetical protein